MRGPGGGGGCSQAAGAQISTSEIKADNYLGLVLHDGKTLIYFYDFGERAVDCCCDTQTIHILGFFHCSS